MRLRPIFVALLALVMLLSPLVVKSGGAMAMAPVDHQAQMMGKGHCDDQPGGGMDGKGAQKPCCVAMLTAVTAAAGSPAEPLVFARIADRSSLEPFQHSYLAKLATPPPRRA